MTAEAALRPTSHSHVFLGSAHAQSERRAWAVIWLCGAMMLVEIVGGLVFGSIALVADGLHMSTHAGALLLAALAYSFSRTHAEDPRFTFGTGKLGDLAGFASAVILALIAALIGYEAVRRFFAPVPINFLEAIPIACLGLCVNLASVWLLGGGEHGHAHDHAHAHAHEDFDDEHVQRIPTHFGEASVEIDEADDHARFRLSLEGRLLAVDRVSLLTVRPRGKRQAFTLIDRGGYLESLEDIPEPHEFTVELSLDGELYRTDFREHGSPHASAHRDNNMRAAVIHVVADAAVSVLVITGLVLARVFGWMWMDPLAGIIGACVIASWSWGLIRDTSAILLDMNPDPRMTESLRKTLEHDGDRLGDLHVWRLGPGHLGAIVSVITAQARGAAYYRDKLARFRSLSHLTIEVERAGTNLPPSL